MRVKKRTKRCNIPVDFVAHRVTVTAREQEKLRPHTLQKLQRWSTDCYSVEAEDDTGHNTVMNY